MLYLSLLELNSRSRQAQAEIRNPYEMHRTLAKAFGKGDACQGAARCLFRVDEDRHETLRLLVQSRASPAWEELTVGPDYLKNPPQVKPFTPAFQCGQTLAFRLRANPTKRSAANKEGEGGGKRVGLYTEEERLAWLERQGTGHGFRLETVTVFSDVPAFCQVKGQTAVFSAVRFEGVLRVTEPPALVSGVADGVGAGKGFGFGLLSLSRLK